jgi:hypothetical protein
MSEQRKNVIFSVAEAVGCLVFLAYVLCCGCRTVERAKPLYFSQDAALFTDTLFPEQTVWYTDLKGYVQQVALKPDSLAKGYIEGPTFVHKGRHDLALVFPEERIHIAGDFANDDYTFTSVNGSYQRNRELQFFKTFERLEKWSGIPRLPVYTLQTVLDLEQNTKNLVPQLQATSQRTFDSLLRVYAVSHKFRKLAKGYVQNRYSGALLMLYRLYKDTLAAHGLYFRKVREMLPCAGAINDGKELNQSESNFLYDLYAELFLHTTPPTMNPAQRFGILFDSIVHNFNGLARDYLLSSLLIRSYDRGVTVPHSYEKQYSQYAVNKMYKRLVREAKKQQQAKS